MSAGGKHLSCSGKKQLFTLIQQHKLEPKMNIWVESKAVKVAVTTAKAKAVVLALIFYMLCEKYVICYHIYVGGSAKCCRSLAVFTITVPCRYRNKCIFSFLLKFQLLLCCYFDHTVITMITDTSIILTRDVRETMTHKNMKPEHNPSRIRETWRPDGN